MLLFTGVAAATTAAKLLLRASATPLLGYCYATATASLPLVCVAENLAVAVASC